MTTQAYETQTELGHLSAAISAGATSITLVSGEGSNFDTDLPYDIMIGGDAGEVVSLTAIATDTLTISATSGAWAEGTAVFMIATLSQPRTSGQLALVADIAAAGGGDVFGPGPTTVDRSIPSYNGTGGYTLRANAAPLIASDGRITTLTDATGDQDAVNLRTLASQIVALVSSRRACRLVTVAALPAYTRSTNTLTATANGALSVDGTAVAVGDRILNRHGTGADRGIYTVTATGSAGAPYVLDRATDADAAGDFATGQIVNITAGSTRVGAAYYLSTTGAITLNTTTLTYDPLVPPRGAAANVQYRDSTTGEQEGAANAVITSGDVTLIPYTTTAPSAPSSGSTIFAMLRAGRGSFLTQSQRGPAQGYAPDWLTIPRVWTAGTGATLDTVGTPGPTNVNGGGSAVAQAVANTDFLTQFLRLRLTTNAVANNHAGVRAGTATIFTSASSNRGGFFWQAAFAIHTAPSSARYFIGVYGTSSSVPMTGGAEPSTFLNCAGFMVDSGESVFSWGVNDGTGTCTRTSITGAALTGDTYRYVASICAFPGSTDIYYALEQYDTSGTLALLADSVSTSDTPVAGTLLYDYVHGTPSAASAMSIDISCVVLQRWR